MFFLPVSGDRRVPACAPATSQPVAARLLADDSWSGQDSVSILGPRIFPPTTWRRSCRRCCSGRPLPADSRPVYKARLMRHGMSGAWRRAWSTCCQVDRGSMTPSRGSAVHQPPSFRQLVRRSAQASRPRLSRTAFRRPGTRSPRRCRNRQARRGRGSGAARARGGPGLRGRGACTPAATGPGRAPPPGGGSPAARGTARVGQPAEPAPLVVTARSTAPH